jgi:trans-aconitate methyltransferase
VLAQLPLTGDETVIDGGCGTGRLTARLAERLPRGQVIAVDGSADMIRAAAEHLRPFGDRVRFVVGDLLALDPDLQADAYFSTATMHWITDHPRLFAVIFRALRPGGRLVAQAGGKGNLAIFLRDAHAVMAAPPFAQFLGDYLDPWEFADAATTAERLAAAGFVDVATSEEPAPARFDDEATFVTFVETCVLRLQVARLPEPLRAPFFDAILARVPRPLVLDYRRLNLAGRKILTPPPS